MGSAGSESRDVELGGFGWLRAGVDPSCEQLAGDGCHEEGSEEIHRVLSPGGRVVLGFLPKEWMDRMGNPMDIFTSRAPDDVIAALTTAGFKDVRVERPEPTTPWNVIVATR